MEMDMVIPLNLNLNKKKDNVHPPPTTHSTLNECHPSAKPVLGREQAKRSFLAFNQQWNKTKDNLMADRALQKRPNEQGDLKFTYVVEGEDGREISFPAHLIQYTKTEPQISFCENPHYAKGVYQSRKDVFDTLDEDTKRVMYFIINSSSPCDTSHFAGRYRKWYVDRKTFIGRPPDPSEEESACSTRWESDSEDGSYHQDSTYDFLPRPPPDLLNTKVISKVKINKVELPFFEDDDFLESLISSKPGNKEQDISSMKRDIQEEYSAFMSSLENIDEKLENSSQTRSKSSGSSSTGQDWNFENEKSSREYNDDSIKRRRTPSPDWDQQWRSSRYTRSRERNHRQNSPSPPRKIAAPRTPEQNYSRTDDDWTGSGKIEDDDMLTSDAKRISLDERLELELGIKVESECHASSLISPPFADQQEASPHRRRRGFGPKAAPLGALIFSCPKALPAVPYIPPHLQSLLHQPLVVRHVPPKLDDGKSSEVQVEGNEEKKNDAQSHDSTTPDQVVKKDWDNELRNLEAVACNLETADETILETLEEKLLQFETANILQSSGDSPPTELKEEKSKSIKRSKRPKPPPVELKEAGKGILVMPRVTLLADEKGNQKKGVLFADNVRPGCGTSSEDEEERTRSPPLPVVLPVPVVEASPKKKIKRRKKEKIIKEDFDPEYDLLPPPPPPPGSPPPHLPQGRSPGSSSPTPSATIDGMMSSSPQAIESGAC